MDELLAERVHGHITAAPATRSAASLRADRFRALIERELDDAYRLASVVLGDPVEAEDALQDASEKAWRAMEQLDDDARSGAWFRRIVVNACRDRMRKRKRRRLFEAFREPRESDVVSSDRSHMFGMRDELQIAFERLSPDQRVILALRYEADLTVPALATMLGIPQGTAKSRLHTALGALREGLEADAR